MWQVILIILVIGAFGEACLGKASRTHWEKGLSEQNKRLLKASTWLTAASILGVLGIQFYYQGILMSLVSFMQLVAGAFLMQRVLAKPAIGTGLRLNLALVAGPVSITLLLLIFELYQ